ncbi:MAG TPA: hypothetical protein VLA47_00935 [Nitrospira sp.]|nr:hypothetical protein [Nitrospira sp.]
MILQGGNARLLLYIFTPILKRMERLRGEGQRQRGHCQLLAEKAPMCDGLAMLHRRFIGALGQ